MMSMLWVKIVFCAKVLASIWVKTGRIPKFLASLFHKIIEAYKEDNSCYVNYLLEINKNKKQSVGD